MRGTRAHFHIVGLQQCASLTIPIILQRKDDFLESEHNAVQRSENLKADSTFSCPAGKAGRRVTGQIDLTGDYSNKSSRYNQAVGQPSSRSEGPLAGHGVRRWGIDGQAARSVACRRGPALPGHPEWSQTTFINSQTISIPLWRVSGNRQVPIRTDGRDDSSPHWIRNRRHCMQKKENRKRRRCL
jgi:hypothetical protein